MKREFKFLLIAAQNDAKVKIDNMQTNSKYRFCDDGDETVNHINEYRKLTKKEYKSRYDWVGKVILWELCMRIRFDHTDKWSLHKPESIQENKTRKILW